MPTAASRRLLAAAASALAVVLVGCDSTETSSTETSTAATSTTATSTTEMPSRVTPTSMTADPDTTGSPEPSVPVVLSWSRDDDAISPTGPDGALNHEFVARWDEQGRMLLTTWGSTSCPELPVALEVASPAELVVTVRAWSGSSVTPMTCTGDFSPTLSVVELPVGLDRTVPITVRVGDRTAELLPLRNAVVQTWRPVEDVEPPAAWQTGDADPEEVSTVAWDGEDRILLTTWGSQTCPDVVSTVDLVSASEITLGLTNRTDLPPPAGNTAPSVEIAYVCSADLSPLISRFDAPAGLDTTGPVTVRLSNGLVLELPPAP